MTGSVVTLFVAMFVVAGEMTEEEASAVYERIRFQPVASMPSGILRQVRAALVAVREDAAQPA